MTADEVLAVVRSAVMDVLEVPAETVRPGTRLVADLAADSIAIMQIADLLEERLAPVAPRPVVIADADLDDLTTVGDTVDYVLRKL